MSGKVFSGRSWQDHWTLLGQLSYLINVSWIQVWTGLQGLDDLLIM